MPINIYLKDEHGNTLAHAGGDGALEAAIDALAERSTWLRYIDPYGDTMFNRLQVREFRRELVSTIRDGEALDPSLDAVSEMANECAAGIHLYLWFIAD